MCGITGFVGPHVSLEQLKKGCRALSHRGPDDEGYYVDKGVALGACRLAIRDPAKGGQPMKRSGRVIVYNGELYQTEPLKSKLCALGYRFETGCDTELLLNAFLEFGPTILETLSGMFAFAIWDCLNKTLYLARDRWGEKPLYFTFGDDFIAFASEIKGLKFWPQISWDISLEDLNLFLKNSYITNPSTGWKNIFKLEPGTYLVWREGKLSKSTYFSPKTNGVRTQEDAGVLFHLLKQNVSQCLVSDRAVGAFLSGGIDSTTISYFLAQERPKAPIFSLYWDELQYSEKPFIDAVVSALNLNHFDIKCDPAFFMAHFDSIALLFDEPFADESMVPTYCLAKFAKNQVDVVLTGDGADELFHGYDRYFFKGDFTQYIEVFAASPKAVRELICERDFLTFDTKVVQEKGRSLFDLTSYLPDDILTKVDRCSMGVGLEARAPFLTNEISNFALNCSRSALVGEGIRGKEILRAAMKDHLPKLILERKKMGFGVPLNDWFRSSLKDWMMERLLEGSLSRTGWFLQEGIRDLISNHLARLGNHGRTLLNLLVLEVWLRSSLAPLNYLPLELSGKR